MAHKDVLSGHLIALLGQAGSGKDTVAKMVCEMVPGARTIALADPLKEFCKQVFEFTDDQLWGPSESRNAPDMRYLREDGEYLSARVALQQLGTQWGRYCHPPIWVKYAIRRSATLVGGQQVPLVIITDCRFANEVKIIQEAGGQVWQVLRGNTNPSGLGSQERKHVSETEQLRPEVQSLVDQTIQNNGTLSQLRTVLLPIVEAFSLRL